MVRAMARAVLLTIALVLSASASARANEDIFTLAGSGDSTAAREGMPASRAGLSSRPRVAALPGGGFLVADRVRVWRVDAQGLMHLAAGNGHLGDAGDGGPATQAELSVNDLEALPGGGFLVADKLSRRIRMVGADGVISTVAGGGRRRGEGIPATQARLGAPYGLAALPGGGFLFGEDEAAVRRVGPDGVIQTLGVWGDAVAPAVSLPGKVHDIALAPDGSELLADTNEFPVERLAPTGAVSVVTALDDGNMTLNRVAALPDGSVLFTTDYSGPERIWRVAPGGGAPTVLAGGGPFIATAPRGLRQHVTGAPAARVDRSRLVDMSTLPDGGVLIAHGDEDATGSGGFVDYLTPAAPALLVATILRDRDRVFTPGGMHAVTVSLTMPATVTLTAGGQSITSALPAGESRVIVPPLTAARPQRIVLTATAGTQRASDAVRVYPPAWLPTETAMLVADAIGGGFHDVGACRRYSAARVDCRTSPGTRFCGVISASLAGDRVRWAAYRRCAFHLHPRFAVHPHPLSRYEMGCSGPCRKRIYGRVDEAALAPST
jgi:hypothetical protein